MFGILYYETTDYMCDYIMLCRRWMSYSTTQYSSTFSTMAWSRPLLEYHESFGPRGWWNTRSSGRGAIAGDGLVHRFVQPLSWCLLDIPHTPSR